jgi:hypothetical protein
MLTEHQRWFWNGVRHGASYEVPAEQTPEGDWQVAQWFIDQGQEYDAWLRAYRHYLLHDPRAKRYCPYIPDRRVDRVLP